MRAAGCWLQAAGSWPWVLVIAFFFYQGSAVASEFQIQKIDQKKGLELKKAKKCDLHISFGSYGSGTPIKVEKEISAYLKAKAANIKSLYHWAWGMEGEYDYCVALKNSQEGHKYFEELKKLIPEFSRKGYTTLIDKSGKSWKTTWPK